MSTTQRTDTARLNTKNVPITSPCPADIPNLTAEERKRFCTVCNKDVHNLSAMSEPEAQTLLDTQADLCVSYEVDDRGNVAFQQRRTNRMSKAISMAAGFAMMITSQSGCGDITNHTRIQRGKSLLERLVDSVSNRWSPSGKTPLRDRPRPMMGAVALQPKTTKAKLKLQAEPSIEPKAEPKTTPTTQPKEPIRTRVGRMAPRTVRGGAKARP